MSKKKWAKWILRGLTPTQNDKRGANKGNKMKGLSFKTQIKCHTRPDRVSSSKKALCSAGYSGRCPNMTKYAVMFCLSLVSTFAFAEDLLMDEQGPTVPEAIDTVTANTDFLTPTYTAPAEQTAPVPSEVDILNEIFGSDTPIPEQNIPTPKPVQHTFTPQTGVQRTDMPLLTPLPPQPIFARADAPIPAPKTYFTQPPYADQALAMASSPASSLSMPREIRITFYKDQTSFSAQALKWVKSLAVRVVNDPRLVAEIRISEESPKIQEKRLSILLQILKEEGITAHQIRLYKTARDANSILIGYADNPDLTRVNDKNSKKGVQKTINW